MITEEVRAEVQRGLRTFLCSLPLNRRIAVLRVARGMTLQQVAYLIARESMGQVETSPSAISRWETGDRRPRRATLQLLEKMYELPSGVLTDVSIENEAEASDKD